MRGMAQVGAPRPVAWFHLFDKVECQEWRACREAAGYGGTKMPVTGVRALCCRFMYLPLTNIIIYNMRQGFCLLTW